MLDKLDTNSGAPDFSKRKFDDVKDKAINDAINKS